MHVWIWSFFLCCHPTPHALTFYWKIPHLSPLLWKTEGAVSDLCCPSFIQSNGDARPLIFMVCVVLLLCLTQISCSSIAGSFTRYQPSQGLDVSQEESSHTAVLLLLTICSAKAGYDRRILGFALFASFSSPSWLLQGIATNSGFSWTKICFAV